MIEKNQNNLIYQAPDGSLKIDIFVQDKDIWLTRKKMSEIFDVKKQTIDYHIHEIYKTWELDKNTTTKFFMVVQTEGDRQIRRKIEHSNLDMIISIWYRINSSKATKFRIRATKILKEYTVKWFALDDERLKNGGKNPYFDELLERIRDIRTSERNFYQKITDIYATSIDYNPSSEETIMFFKIVQNKMHYAIHGKTAAEIIYKRSDYTKKNYLFTIMT